MSTLTAEGQPYTPTRLRWSFLTTEGDVWHRAFVRNRPTLHELILHGLEEPTDPSHHERVSGKFIISGGRQIERKRFVWTFPIDEHSREEAEELVDLIRGYFPGLPPSALLERLLMLSEPAIELGPPDATKILERLDAVLEHVDAAHRGIDIVHSGLVNHRYERKRWWRR